MAFLINLQKCAQSGSKPVEHDGGCDVVLIERNTSSIQRIVLDMSGVSFIDSMGVNALKQVTVNCRRDHLKTGNC